MNEDIDHFIYISPSSGLAGLGVYINWDLHTEAEVSIMTTKLRDDEPQRCVI